MAGLAGDRDLSLNGMKKTAGVIMGFGLLGFVAHTAFAELTNTLNATSDTVQTTSRIETTTTNTQTTTTNTDTVTTPALETITAQTQTSTESTPTQTSVTSSSVSSSATPVAERLTAHIALEGSGAVTTGTRNIVVTTNREVVSVEILVARNDTFEHLGQAQFDSAQTRWVYAWDSVSRTPDGSYRLYANVKAADGTIARSNAAGTLVRNEKNEETKTATATEKTQTVSRAEAYRTAYLQNIEAEKQRRIEARQRELATTLKKTVAQGEAQPATPERVLPKTGVASIPARPSRLTSPVDFEKVINEKSQDLKDAIEKGDTTKKAEIIRDIVRTTQGGAEGSVAPATTELTQKVEEGVAKLEQVITDQTRGVVDEKTFKVERVEVAETVTKPDGTQTASKIAFRGKGLPDSFVTLYIFSIPTIVTVKTDSEGNWNYTLDKELEDGSHQVYVGITDVKGKVVVKSNPLPFVKTASAITVEEALAVPQVQAAPSFVENNYFYGVVTIIILVVAAVLIFMGIRLSRRTPESDIPNQNQ